MTIYQLQQDLAAETERILAGMVFKDPAGNSEHMKVYLQELPKREQIVKPGNLMPEEEEEDPYPFCIVRTESGVIYGGAQVVKIMLIFGIFDDDLDNMGHQTLLNVIHKVTEHFMLEPVLKNRYQMDGREGIQWIVDDEDRYPYYIAGLEMVWNTSFAERKEDRYA